MKLLCPSVLATLLCTLAACGGSEPAQAALPGSDLPERYLLAAAPADAQEVAVVWSDATAGAEVTVRGVVGGAVQPFIDGLAAFTLVDSALVSCAGDGMGCATPWDYCCEDPGQMARGSVTIEFREGGDLLATSARGFHGLDHLATAVVVGTLERDDRGNVTIVASGVHVR